MSTPIRQSSFSGGEISPQLYGRTDSPRYAAGLRTCKNWLPIQHGALVNRPGTRMVDKVHVFGPGDQVRLVPFVFSDGQAFVLEFGWGYIRFYQNGAPILGVPLGAYSAVTTYALNVFVTFGGVTYRSKQAANLNHQPDISPTWWDAAPEYEIATVYNYDQIPYLKFAQSGDVIQITYGGQVGGAVAPQELKRISNANWTIAAASFSPAAYFAGVLQILNATGPTQINGAAVATSAVFNIASTYQIGDFVLYTTGGQTHLYQSLQANNVGNVPVPNTYGAPWWDWEFGIAKTYANGDYVWNHVDQKLYISITDGNVGHQPDTNPLWWSVAIDASHPPKEWQWAATIVYLDDKGVARETLASAPTPTTRVALYTDRPAQIFWTGIVAPGFSYSVQQYSVYRGRNGVFGYVGSLFPGTGTFRDDGREPDYGIQPPRATDPFKYANGAGTTADSYPACVCFHEQRRVYARSSQKPQDFWGSKQGQTDTYDVNFPVQETDSYNFRLSSQVLEEIRSLASLRHLVLLTGQGEFSAEGAPGQAITPLSIRVRRHSGHGSSWLSPLTVGNTLLFNTAKGNYIRDFAYDFTTDSYTGDDLTADARHLFDGHTIRDWAYAAVPYPIIYAVRDDGVLLSLTYDRSRRALAWAQHTTNGTFSRVCVVPEGTEDAVYFIVNRGGTYYVERMASRYVPDVRRGVFLDCSLVMDNDVVQTTTMKLQNQVPDWNPDATVDVIASVGAFVGASDVGDQIVFDPDGAALRVTIIAYVSATQVTGRLEAVIPVAFQSVATLNWAFARDTVTGLSHLNGYSVNVLADGVVQGPFVVAGGSITLAPPAVIAQVGLAYNSDLETLDVAAPSIKTSVKAVEKVVLEVVDTRGLSAGQDLDTLTPFRSRQVSDSYGAPALFTGQLDVRSKTSWKVEGKAAVRQSDPLPACIVAVTRHVEVGGTA